MVLKCLKTIGSILGGVLVVAIITYIFLAVYFTERFNTNTFINGIDATGMSADTLNEILSEASSGYVMTITDYDGQTYDISGSDIGYHLNYYEQLSEILRAQNQFTWFENVIFKTSYEVTPSFGNFDSAKTSECVKELYPFLDYDNSNAEVYITTSLGKYFLIDETRKILDKDAAYAAICSGISNGVSQIDLSEFYSDTVYSDEQQKYVDLFSYIDKFQSTEFNYVDGDLSRHIDFTETNKWLNLDENQLPYLQDGRLSIDDGKMQDTIELMASVFNTEDDIVDWTRKDGTVAHLPYKGNGYKVNTMEEADRIQEEIFTGKSYERRPIYSQEAMGRGNSIVGKDYVEVDFENQKMYCYRDGQLKLESDVVTGNIRNHCNTPEMVSSIYFMQKNRTLHGDNYDTFVYYWMAFYNHYGLHDATWRKSFGGDIYLTNGSHGCVNLPKDVAGELYDLVYVGMPVVLYYGEEQQ